jgi:hypothetical protein
VAIFDGSTVVNRNSLINQFRTLARAYDKQSWDSEGLALAVDLNAPLPEFAPQKLRVMSSSGCSVLQSLPHAVIQLAQVDPGRRPSATVLRLTEALRDAAAGVMEECAAYQPSAREVPSSAFDLARRYELCFAGARVSSYGWPTIVRYAVAKYGRACGAMIYGCMRRWYAF